jgi:hypothetical protein
MSIVRIIGTIRTRWQGGTKILTSSNKIFQDGTKMSIHLSIKCYLGLLGIFLQPIRY